MSTTVLASRIYINQGKSVLVDTELIPVLAKYRLSCFLNKTNNRFYVLMAKKTPPGKKRWVRGKPLPPKKVMYLHRWIMRHELKKKPGMVVDHISGDSLDCRKSNLRVCTRQQNALNCTKLHKSNKSSLRGVQPLGERWIAVLAGRHLGCYATARDAAIAYDQAAAKVYEHAYQNLPGSAHAPAPKKSLRISKSGFIGVREKNGRYEATYADKFIGSFDSAEDAAHARDFAARQAGAKRMNFDDDHRPAIDTLGVK